MKRQFLKFTPNRGNISVAPGFNVDQLVGSYTLTVWDKDGRSVMTHQGEVAEDIAPIELPSPQSQEDMFMVELNATIVSLNPPEEGDGYRMTLLTKQSGQAIADPAEVTGPLPATKEVITIILVMTPVKTDDVPPTIS